MWALTDPSFVTSGRLNFTIMSPAIRTMPSIDRTRSASVASHVRKFLKHSALCLGRRRTGLSRPAPSNTVPMPIT